MLFTIKERLSDSPYVDRIWRTQGERAGTLISQSKVNTEMVLTRYQGKTTLTVRGPETRQRRIEKAIESLRAGKK